METDFKEWALLQDIDAELITDELEYVYDKMYWVRDEAQESINDEKYDETTIEELGEVIDDLRQYNAEDAAQELENLMDELMDLEQV